MGPVARKRIVLTLGEQAHVDILADPVPGTSYYARWNTEGPAAGSGANATNHAFMVHRCPRRRPHTHTSPSRPITHTRAHRQTVGCGALSGAAGRECTSSTCTTSQ